VFSKISTISKGLQFDPYDSKFPIYEDWEDFMQDFNDNAPAGFKNGVQTGQMFWAWMLTEREFVVASIQGSCIALGFGFLVLLLATRNIVMALMSILTCFSIMLSVVGVMYLYGWELGVAEAIGMVIAIGFSIDYVVHFATHYIHSGHRYRADKMQ
jgi:hypothetical protein